MEKWILHMKKEDYKGIAERFSIDQVVARVIRNRGIIGDEAIREFLYGDKETLHDPANMKDLVKAAQILLDKISQNRKIRILGDYDVDGLMSTYILKDGLDKLGGNVDYRIPHRVTDGYGLNMRLIDEAYADQIDTILTCDNGIAAVEEIAHAKELGMTVIVTDHHQLKPEGAPKADAVVDTNQPDCQYPFPYLCGAGIAYKLIKQLFAMRVFPADAADVYLEFAGFATIEDSVKLVGENRILAKECMKRLNHTTNPGLRALKQVTGVEEGNLTMYQVGFLIGPCLNASGRLDTAYHALDLLLTKDEKEAGILANELKAMNETRKQLTEEGQKQAEKMVEETDLKNQKVLVLFMPKVHESLAGIIAGRIKDRYYRPTIVLTRGENNIKGSGRSIEEFALNEAIDRCRDIPVFGGGHPLAAGVSMEEKYIEAFRQRMNELCTLSEEELLPKVCIDVPMPIGYVTMDLIRQLDGLGPFGVGNPRPLFAQKDLHVVSSRILGAARNVLRMTVQDETGTKMEAVYFGAVEELAARLELNSTLSIAYQPTINSYMGKESIQLNIKHFY